MTNWGILDQTYLMSTAERVPIAVDYADGNYLYDTNNKGYLDLFTGLGVNILGHRHRQVLLALQKQQEKFLHISNLLINPPAITLAKRLITHVWGQGQGKVFFTCSGAEATEALLKLLFKWNSRLQLKRNGLVVLKNSFHGRTLGALHLTRQPGIYQDYPEMSFPIYEVPPNDIEELRRVCTMHQPWAILVEPILGSGGIIELTEEYLQTISRLCKQESMLFCIDEIQTGVGRTGKLFAHQHFSIKPDVLLFAKAIGGGLPLGGVMAKNEIAQMFQPGDHGTTFAPSPLAAAMGNAVLDVLLNGLLEESQEVINDIWNRLKELPTKYPDIIDTVSGRGMMIGIHTNLPVEKVKKIQEYLLQQGILINITAQTVLRLLPPLTLTAEDIQFFFRTLDRALQEIR